MIRVLHMGHSRKWRGGENQVRQLIKGMRAQYHEIEHYIAYPDGALMFDRLAGEVKAVLRLPSKRPVDARSILALKRFARQHDIDILDAHSGSAHSLAFYTKFLLPEVRLVVHRRVNFPIKKFYFTRRKYLSGKIDHYIAISSAIRNQLADYGISRDKISLIKSSVDHRAYRDLSKPQAKKNWCERCGLDSGGPLLGFAAALEPSKNPMLFVEVVKQLRRQGHDVNAIIAGRGGLHNQLEKEIRESGLDEHLKLTGFVDNVPELFAAFDFFILPSKQEGLGTVLLEAIHSGCLVIASDVGGIGEIIRHEKTGMLAKSEDVPGFVEAVQALLSSEELRACLRESAAEHVNSSFNFESLLHRHYQLYHRLAA